jgi:hypothetical protein
VLPRDRLGAIDAPALVVAGGASPEWARNGVVAAAAAILVDFFLA